MGNEIENFVKRLSKKVVSKETTNMYYGESYAAKIRRENLVLYLKTMAALNPKILLLGEAPGYKGCRITGVPFSSERVINENSFFKNQPYACINNPDALEGEISATIVWNQLNFFKEKPLIWNIFPFHPHTISDKKTNRTPNAKELEFGLTILNELLEIFPVKKIVALGRKPESKIKNLNYNYTYVRHPANGGKNKFVSGIEKVFNQLN